MYAPTLREIIDAVAEVTGYRPMDLRGKRRLRRLSSARQITMTLCRELTDASLQEVGNALGMRDHSTIVHGVNRINQLLANEPHSTAARWYRDAKEKLTAESCQR